MACENCWKNYIKDKITDGRACGRMRCFGLRCAVPMGPKTVESMVEGGLVDRFWWFYIEQEVERSKGKLACCPSENCEWILERGKYGVSRVDCGGCGEEFCVQCLHELHHPVACRTLAVWEEKNVSESENVKWILAHTKPCPKCGKPIEKNQGCNHIHCHSNAGGCGFHFCWMCGKDWNNHSSGDPYSCNIYKANTAMQDRDKVREKHKNDLNRYLFFFERYNGHHKARLLAKKQLNFVEQKCERVHQHYNLSVLDMNFMADALRQIAKCRKVLMYTYVYGYFLAEESPMRQLFEHLQKNLEEKTDKLHEFIEKDFDHEVLDLPRDFFRPKQDPIISFSTLDELPDSTKTPERMNSELLTFRSKVTNLISVVDKFTNAVVNDLHHDNLMSSSRTSSSSSSATGSN